MHKATDGMTQDELSRWLADGQKWFEKWHEDGYPFSEENIRHAYELVGVEQAFAVTADLKARGELRSAMLMADLATEEADATSHEWEQSHGCGYRSFRNLVEYVIDDLRRNGSFMGDRTEGIDLGDWHSPDISGAYIMKGSLVFDQGRYEEALSWYGKALEVNPSSAITILEVSECHKAMGNMAEALERAKEALGIAWELSTIAKARRTVAFCEGELGDHDACAANLVISGDYEPSIIVTNEFLWLRSQGWAGQMTLDDALRIAPEQTPGIAASNLAQEAMVVTMKLIQEARIGDISLLQEIMTNLLMSERSTRSQVTNREDVATA